MVSMAEIFKKVDAPFSLYEIDILAADDETLQKISDELGLALNVDENKRVLQGERQESL